MHASKGRKYYACTEKRSQKRREIMVTITRRDLCRLALLSLMVAFDGRSYRAEPARMASAGEGVGRGAGTAGTGAAGGAGSRGRGGPALGPGLGHRPGPSGG